MISMRVYRLQTDTAERIIGRLVSPALDSADRRRRNARDRAGRRLGRVLDGRTVLDLQESLQLRRAKSWANSGSRPTGFTDGMVDRLKAMGLISEIIS